MPLTTFIALLRGVNVGKAKRVPMADLRALLSSMGYAAVATLQNSGNAIFRTSTGNAMKHSADIAAAISSHLNVEVPVVVKSGGELAAVIADSPIEAPPEEHSRFLVAFVQEAKGLSGLAAIHSRVLPSEQFAIGKHAA